MVLPRRPFEELPPKAQKYVQERERSIEMNRRAAEFGSGEIRAQAQLVAQLWEELSPEEVDMVLAYHGYPARRYTAPDKPA